MNVSYASDPYWGEKAAQYYYDIDHALQDKDLNQYAIGITGTKKLMSEKILKKLRRHYMLFPKARKPVCFSWINKQKEMLSGILYKPMYL